MRWKAEISSSAEGLIYAAKHGLRRDGEGLMNSGEGQHGEYCARQLGAFTHHGEGVRESDCVGAERAGPRQTALHRSPMGKTEQAVYSQLLSYVCMYMSSRLATTIYRWSLFWPWLEK